MKSVRRKERTRYERMNDNQRANRMRRRRRKKYRTIYIVHTDIEAHEKRKCETENERADSIWFFYLASTREINAMTLF